MWSGGFFFDPGRTLLIYHLLRELAHKAAADALIDHRTRPVWVTDVTVNAVTVTVVMMMVPVVMMVIVVVAMVMTAASLIIERVAELGMVMVHIDLAFGQPLFERRHQILGVDNRPGPRLFDTGHEGVYHVVLIGQVMCFEELHIRSALCDPVDIGINPIDQSS